MDLLLPCRCHVCAYSFSCPQIYVSWFEGQGDGYADWPENELF